jgi:hypothetical protein
VDVYQLRAGDQTPTQIHNFNPSTFPPVGLFWTIELPEDSVEVDGGFAGEFVRNTAQMEWTATVGDYTFVSDPLATSSSSFAEIGREWNGSFFPQG